jgi:hypothetical protein
VVAPGCSYKRYTTESARSATEQLLVSGAIERAVTRLEWPEISGRRIAVETVALNSTDAPYLEAAVEARARTLGAYVVPREEAEQVLLVMAGALGTASREATFGVPSVPTPVGMTPEIPVVRVLKQRGYAKVRLLAFKSSGQHVAESPAVLERVVFELYSFLFLAFRRNDIYAGEAGAIGID